MLLSINFGMFLYWLAYNCHFVLLRESSVLTQPNKIPSEKPKLERYSVGWKAVCSGKPQLQPPESFAMSFVGHFNVKDIIGYSFC